MFIIDCAVTINTQYGNNTHTSQQIPQMMVLYYMDHDKIGSIGSFYHVHFQK